MIRVEEAAEPTMMKTTWQAAAAALLGSLTLFACTERDQGPLGNDLSANDWLLSADSDTERFERLQQQLRGFDQPMWEVGDRYSSLHAALERENYDLALYHWDKIGTTIENGIAKRPGRADSARALFLDSTFAEVRTGLEQRNPKQDGRLSASRAPPACPVIRPSKSNT